MTRKTWIVVCSGVALVALGLALVPLLMREWTSSLPATFDPSAPRAATPGPVAGVRAAPSAAPGVEVTLLPNQPMAMEPHQKRAEAPAVAGRAWSWARS